MDVFYNQTEAVQVLDDAMVERAKSGTLQGYTFNQESNKNNFGIEKQGRVFKLVLNAKTPDVEEASVGLQGIVTQISLPPFAENTGRSHQRLMQLRQGITICGLGSANFTKMLDNLLSTHAMFSRFTPGGRLRVAEFIGSANMVNGTSGTTVAYPTISAGNRVFMPTNLASTLGFAVQAIKEDIDPNGVLNGVDSARLVHTEENDVKYYLLSGDKTRYLPVSPVVFQVGDIVELQVSLVSFPATKNTTKRIGIPDNESSSNAVEYTVKLILRSVLLLDGSMTSAAYKSRTEAATLVRQAQPASKMKRRNAYEVYEEEQERVSKQRYDSKGDREEVEAEFEEEGNAMTY